MNQFKEVKTRIGILKSIIMNYAFAEYKIILKYNGLKKKVIGLTMVGRSRVRWTDDKRKIVGGTWTRIARNRSIWRGQRGVCPAVDCDSLVICGSVGRYSVIETESTISARSSADVG